MRVDELTFRQARAIKPTEANADVDKIRESLKAAGYQLIGEGWYSEVWEKSTSNIVVRINEGIIDTCWLNFATIARANKDNPHLPKIGRVMHSNDDFIVVFMEKLVENNGNWGFDNEFLEFRRLNMVLKTNTLEKRLSEFDNWPKSFIKTLLFLKDSKPEGCFWDIHRSNVMWRNNTPVIMDPWS